MKNFRSTSQAIIKHGGAMRAGPDKPISFWASFDSHHSAQVNTPNKIATAQKPSRSGTHVYELQLKCGCMDAPQGYLSVAKGGVSSAAPKSPPSIIANWTYAVLICPSSRWQTTLQKFMSRKAAGN
jgi:hypothetical protein